MSLSIYDACVPVFVRGLDNLSAILEKAVLHVEAQALDAADLIDARLAPDMLTLAGQVQRASDASKACGSRLAGIEIPSFADDEKTFPQLQARIAKTVTFLQSLDPPRIEGSAERMITINVARAPLTISGKALLLTFSLPNFFFHVTTAYDILRQQGVTIGKMDYLGNLQNAG